MTDFAVFFSAAFGLGFTLRLSAHGLKWAFGQLGWFVTRI
jgi:hypothetical protein